MLLYFIEGIERADAATLREKGLGHILFESGPADIHATPANKGPGGGKPGVTVRVGLPGMAGAKFVPAQQEWRRMPETSPGCWLGWWKDEPPTMAGLLRRRIVKGHKVALMTGEEVIVPLARRVVLAEEGPAFADALDQVTGVNSAGEWTVGQVVAWQAHLWDIAEKFFEGLRGAKVTLESGEEQPKVRMTVPDLHDDALAVLQTNYRIGRAEAGALGILSKRTCIDIMHALVDYPTFIEWHEKKAEAAPAGSTT